MADDGTRLVDSLIGFEFILPEQQDKLNGGRAQGERNLLFEIFAGALHDLTNPNKEVRVYARRWIIRGDVGDVTCQQCCEIFDLDWEMVKERVEAGLLKFDKLRRQNLSGRPLGFSTNQHKSHDPYRAFERASARDRRFTQFELFEVA